MSEISAPPKSYMTWLGQHMQHGMYLQVLASVYPSPRHIAPPFATSQRSQMPYSKYAAPRVLSNSSSIVCYEVSHSSQFVYKKRDINGSRLLWLTGTNRATSPFGPPQPISLTPEGRYERPLIVRHHFGSTLLFICPIVFIHTFKYYPFPAKQCDTRHPQSRMTAHCFPL